MSKLFISKELDMDEMQQLWDQAKMLHVGEASHD